MLSGLGEFTADTGGRGSGGALSAVSFPPLAACDQRRLETRCFKDRTQDDVTHVLAGGSSGQVCHAGMEVGQGTVVRARECGTHGLCEDRSSTQ